jgi:rod shape-determining protein MreD
MRQGNIISYIAFFILFVLLQIVFFRNIVLFDYALCFLYIGYLIIFPFDIKPTRLMLVGFALGIMIDTFYDTVGINAFVCVLVAFIRPYILQTLTPGGGYDNQTEISVSSMGFLWFFKYATLMILIHHFVFFLLEAWSLKHILEVFIRTFFSSIFTFFTLILFQYLVKSVKK